MLVDVGGLRLNVIDEGTGDPVLLLHGLGASWRDWEAVLEGPLARHHRLVVVEARGHGRSDRPPGAYDFPLLASDVAKVARELRVDRAHVVGHSMGGMIAQALALGYPRLVHALILANTSGQTDEALAAMNHQAADTIEREGLAAMIASFTPMMWGEGARKEHPEIVRRYGRDQSSNDPDSFARAMRAIAALDHLGELERVQAPTLVVWSDEDVLTPRPHAEALAAAIPSAELAVLEGFGHLTPLEAPVAFSEVVLEFLARHPLPRAGEGDA